MAFDINKAEERPDPLSQSSTGFDLSKAQEAEDPLKKKKTTLKEDFKIGLANIGNTVDTAASLLFANTELRRLMGTSQDDVYKGLEDRIKSREQFSNPEKKEQGFSGKAASILTTLPSQMLTFPLSPFSTGKTAIDAGESLDKALTATGIDTLGNIAGVGLPGAAGASRASRFVSGVGIGGAQDYLTKAAIQSNMETEAGRKAFDPTLEDALLSGLTQGALVSLAKPGTNKKETERERQERILAEQRAIEAQRPKEQAEVPFEKTNESQQMELFDQPEMGRMANPYEAKLGDWRVDENGIPIKADLSMEVQNLQEPLQRNLWGDELERTRNPVGVEATLEDGIRQLDDEGQGSGLNLTDAIDTMPQGPDRQMALDLLRPELPASGELQGARAMANNRQRGVLDFQAIIDAFPDFVKSKIKLPLFRGVRSDYGEEERTMKGKFGEGVYLTGTPRVANMYASSQLGGNNVRQSYVNLQKPFEISMLDDEYVRIMHMKPAQLEAFTNKLKAKGYDGIVLKEYDNTTLNEVVVFDPKNVKNAFSTPKTRMSNRGQRGAIDVTAIAEGLKSIRLRSLERLQKLTLEGVRQSVNQQDTPLPEKEMVLRVSQQVANEKGQIDPEKMATALNNELANQELDYKIEPTYATFGLNNIGIGQVPAATVVFKAPFEISDNNHFSEPNYFGHVRLFQPDENNAFVVEVQSDLAQKVKAVDDEELKQAIETVKNLDEQLQIIYLATSPNIFKSFYDITVADIEKINALNDDFTLMIEENLGERFDLRQEKVYDWGVQDEPIYTWDDWKQIIEEDSGIYKGQQVPRREEIQRQLDFYVNHYRKLLEKNYSEVDATRYQLERAKKLSEKAAPISAALKVWPQRLVRETLAAITRKGGPGKKVHFATADTMAKVEGWIDNHADAEIIIKRVEDRIAEDTVLLNLAEQGQTVIDTYDLNLRPITKEKLAARIERLKKEKEGYELILTSTPRWGDQQGIYDRHKRVVESFVRDLGGVDYTDENGNTWITVTTEPQYAKPVLYGAKGNMKGTQRGAADTDFLLTLATGGLYPIVKKLQEGKPMKVGDPMIPKDENPQDVLQVARTEKDITTSFVKNIESGGSSAAMNRRSTAVLAASRWTQNALKRADFNNRAYVFPLEDIARKLSAEELETVTKLVMSEDMASQGFDRGVLEKNLNVKQLEVYDAFRQMMDAAYEKQNETRVALGEEPLSKREFYMSSRWQGDFRQPVKDANGRLVYYLADTTKSGLKGQIEALKAQYPDLVIDPKDAHTVSMKKGEDIVTAYKTMKRILGENDPAVAKIAQFMEEMVMKDTSNTLGQQKHFERKAGIRGYVGDRPGKNSTKESTEFMRQQVQYAKNAFKWAEMQKAGESIKKLINDEVLIDLQPKNVEYIRDYYKTNLGYGEAEFIKALENSIRTTGISPNSVASGVSAAKSAFILQKLLASPGYIAANLIQTTWVLPTLTMLRGQGYKGNPLKALGAGMPLGIALANGHWVNVLGGENVLPKGDNFDFYRQAFQYAEDNGITSRSSYDESPIGANSSLPAKALDVTAKFTMAYPETIVRSIAFMSYAQMLKDSGKFKDNVELFQKAEEHVNNSMVDYREGERPMLFAKLGIMGNAFNTLQTFPVSYYNQWRLMFKEFGQGNPMPLVTAIALQYALAGIIGLPGVQDLDDIYQGFKKLVAELSPETWAKMKDNEFFRDPKMWLLKNVGPGNYAGWLSEYWDVSMTSRVAAPVLGDMATSVVGPAQDAMRQVGAFGKALADPTNDVKWAQSAMLSAPVGLQGLLEQGPLADYTGAQQPEGTRAVFKSTDLAQRKNLYERSPREQTVRNWGVRSNAEVLTKEANYRTNTDAELSAQAASKIPDSIYNAIRKGNTQEAKDKAMLYFRLTGRPITRAMLEKQFKDEFFTDTERIQNSARTVEAVKRSKQITELVNAINQ